MRKDLGKSNFNPKEEKVILVDRNDKEIGAGEFRLRLRQAAQKGFRRSSTTAQTFLLVFLTSSENLRFRHERVL
ncbi:MAG: hypothetical protein A3I88_02870 [Candidatus Portnoybacteria bacterium RIFCSPLOWO2_12_FULL_39_9]|uniref:Uncharacterized protein n=1 Tax=Candidatus Portnoybacteria bacterium RIFCSPHIGHO2_12_FULL_38_9 TaxID=1801997 RepID=A0A1G2FIU4_9BACT|nr:MAG: hypothetical protein A3H00_00365 [Candidatus Portnoybacteria bacterium RBG_13_40_8]OGZ36774.1 MAG: hypothetical protein A2646_01745 [Candidatus Portnoybacteria bacterium RIFCSPHIGHO2_02_FULL_39_12]OGZ37570.1 MAG: hypothetical protein A3J64_02085 [Candidatus Portnoybacteria bacterium RIFCSPHIGHO2_12_FULL_38_9]OGZ41248.1 MAG: hypothetical protein A3I88_02870 [Candidatus Portnoybacteria bacterium RIFCSPLOWO2_12_FULL_39_9]